MNKRSLEQRKIMLRARRKVLNIEKTINKGPFKDIPVIDLAKWGRTSNVIDSILDNNTVVPGEDWVTNLTDLPDPTKHPGKTIYVLNFGVGGSPWISNGVIWIPATGILTLANFYNPVNLGSPYTTDTILRQVLIPKATQLGGSVMRIGDIIRLTIDSRKVGNTNTYTRAIRAGINGTTADSAFDTPSAAAAINNSTVERHYFVRLNSTVIKKIGYVGSASINGVGSGGSGGWAGSVTFGANIDNNDFYFSFSAKMDGGTDTFTQRTFMAELFPSGAAS